METNQTDLNPNPLVYQTDLQIIEQEARADLVGKTFEKVLEEGAHYLQRFHSFLSLEEAKESFKNSSRKGGLGVLIEEAYFGYQANSFQGADLQESGVEVKATPLDKNTSGEFVAGERLKITQINFNLPVETDFYKSHVWEKIKSILLIHYFREREKKINLLYKIQFVTMFSPPEKDLPIIIEDYKIIITKIESGLAHELSEGDTNYLGACTSGQTAETSKVEQILYAPGIWAKGRAFCYKNSYMKYVFNEYVKPSKQISESIISDANQLSEQTFDELIQSRINNHRGKTEHQLCEEFDMPCVDNPSAAKGRRSQLAFRMLGVKSNKAEEFEKANIVVKTIKLEASGTMKEDMSFSTFEFKTLVKENWENAEVRVLFDETRFLFVLFQHDGNDYRLVGAKLWHMPYNDLNKTVKSGWKKLREAVSGDVVFTIEQQKKGPVVRNNLPGAKENPIIHARTHTSKTYYELQDGKPFGKGTIANSDELPDGRRIPKHSFFLNSGYIKDIISDLVKS